MNKKQLDVHHIIFEDDDSVIPLTVENYLYGSCHLFALALSEITGWKVGALFNDARELENDETSFYLEHAFCYHPEKEDMVVDCRGILKLDEVWDEYADINGCSLEIKDAKEFLLENISNGNFNNWEEDQIPTMSEPTHVENEKEIIKSFIKEKIKEGIYPSFEKPKIKRKPRF